MNVGMLIDKLQEDLQKLEKEIIGHDIINARAKSKGGKWKYDKKKQIENVKNQPKQESPLNKYDRTPKRPRKHEDSAPGVGEYYPNYDAIRKSPPGVRMVSETNASKIKPYKHEGDRLKLNPHIAVEHSSRYKNISNVTLGPKDQKETSYSIQKLRRGKVPTEKAPSIYSYNPNYEAVDKHVPGFSIGQKDQDITYERYKKTNPTNEEEEQAVEEQPVTMLNVDAAYKAVELQSKGVTAWMPPYYTPKATSDDDQSPPVLLQVDKAQKAIEKQPTGVIKWMTPYYSNDQSPSKSTPTKDTIPEAPATSSTNTFSMPTPAFAKPTKPNAVQLAYREANEDLETQRGPGMYSIHDPDDFSNKGVVKWTTDTNGARKRKVIRANNKRPDIGQYDVDKSYAYLHSRQKANLEFAKPRVPTKEELRLAAKLSKMIGGKLNMKQLNSLLRDTKSAETTDKQEFSLEDIENLLSNVFEDIPGLEEIINRPPFEENNASSETDSLFDSTESSSADDDDSSFDESKHESKFEGKYNESKYEESSVSDNDSDDSCGMENLAKWIHKHRAKKNPSKLTSNAKRRALRLKKHLDKKTEEQRGPSTVLQLNHAAVEPSLATGIVDVKKSMESKKQQSAKNLEMRQKMLRNTDPRAAEEFLLQKCGIDPSLLESDQPEQVPSIVEAPAQATGVFRYHQPTILPKQARQKIEAEKQAQSELGPGKYEIREKWAAIPQDVMETMQSLHELKSKIQKLRQDGQKSELSEALKELKVLSKQVQNIRKGEEMTRAQGRNLKRVTRKGHEEEIPYLDGNTDRNTLGPGHYVVDPTISRFGKAKEVAARMHGGERFESAIDDMHQDEGMLDLEPNIDVVRKSAPGKRGFTFSKIVTANREVETNEPVIELEPNYEYGKYYEPGKNLVAMNKQSKASRADKTPPPEPVLELEPEKAEKHVRPRVRGFQFGEAPVREQNIDKFANMASMGDEFTFAIGDEMLPDALMVDETAPARGDYVKKKSKVKGHVDFDKQIDRKEAAATDAIRDDEAYQQDYDIDKALKHTKRSMPKTVAFDKQSARALEKVEELEEYMNAVYPGVENAMEMLGGLNAKGVQRTRSAKHKTTVDMSRGHDRFEIDPGDEQQPVLDLDVDAAVDAVLARYRSSGPSFDSQVPRWQEQERQLQKAGESKSEPDLAVLDHALSKLSMGNSGRMTTSSVYYDMNKRRGREEPMETIDETILDIDVGEEPGMLRKRVTGGAFAKASREIHTQSALYNDSESLDVLRGDEYLKKAPIGGAIGMTDEHISVPVEKAKLQEQQILARDRKKIQKEAKSKKESVKQSRKESLSRLAQPKTIREKVKVTSESKPRIKNGREIRVAMQIP